MTVRGIFPIANISSHPETSFYMDPTELFRGLDALEAKGWDILAFYHSHPTGARTDPSASDLRGASYPDSLQVIIVPGEGGAPDSIRAFLLADGAASEVPIIVVNE